MGSGPAPDKYRGRCDGAVADCGGAWRPQDPLGAAAVLVRLFSGFSIVQTVFADGGYGGGLIDWT